MESKITYQTLDPAASLIAIDDERIFKQKSLHLKFNPAKITRIEIKLSKKCNLQARLYSDKLQDRDSFLVIMKFYTYDPPRQIYNSIIECQRVFTQMKVFLDDDVGIYNLQLFGITQPKQTKMDQFLIKSLQDNVGSFANFTNQVTFNKDPAGRGKQINLKKLQEEQDLQDAIEQSYLESEFEKINQEKHLLSNKNYVIIEDDEMSLEYEPQDSSIPKNQKLEIPKQNPQKNLGYTDPQDNPKNHQKYHSNNDEIKLNWMIKYQSEDIDQKFMQVHTILEQSLRRNKSLKQIMYN